MASASSSVSLRVLKASRSAARVGVLGSGFVVVVLILLSCSRHEFGSNLVCFDAMSTISSSSYWAKKKYFAQRLLLTNSRFRC